MPTMASGIKVVSGVLAGMLVIAVPAWAADGGKISAAQLVDTMLALQPADVNRPSLIEERRMVCESNPELGGEAARVCSGAVVVDLGPNGVITGELEVTSEKGRVLHVTLKLKAVRGDTLHDAVLRRLGEACGKDEPRPLRGENGELSGEQVAEAWMRKDEPRVVIWIREPEYQGFGVVFVEGNDEGLAKDLRKTCKQQ